MVFGAPKNVNTALPLCALDRSRVHNMAEGGRRSKVPDDEEQVDEEAVDEEEDEGASGTRARHPTKRRAERIAKAQEQRRRRNLRRAAIAVLIVSIIVLASMLTYVYWPRHKNPIVVMETDQGTIELELFTDKTPVTAGQIEGLVRAGYYNGLTFHRVIKDFVIQTGGGATGGSYDTPIEFESSAGELNHLRGSVGMASTAAKTGGTTQFYICVKDQPSLDGSYAVFGKVVKGMSVVDAISNVATDSSTDEPLSPVYLTKAYIK